MIMTGLIQRLGEFIKFSHTVFALPFALASMLVAARDHRGWPGFRVFALVLVAVVAARTCAMAFNRIVDRRFDALNPRTARRHLPAGEIGLPAAVLLCLAGGVGLLGASWALNPLCFVLSPVALFFLLFYSLTKRFTDFTHVWLGIALAIAPLGAWIAVKGSIDFFPAIDGVRSLASVRQGILVPGTLALAVVLWLVGFDIIYATQDYDFDRRQGLHSLVVRWGPRNALGVAFLSHVFMWAVLVLFGVLCGFRFSYWIGLLLILGLLLFEHFLARKRDPVSINLAFFNLNAAISVILLVVVAVEVVVPWFRLRWY